MSKKVRDIWILVLGTIGFLQQVVGVVLDNDPNYLILAASLTLLGTVPFLRADERANSRTPPTVPPESAEQGQKP